jgi:pimeloyl-ACP methyl ester carboxylesterase
MIKQNNKIDRSKKRKGLRIMLFVLSALLGCVVVLLGWFFILSPGKTEPYRDRNNNVMEGSISEKIFVDIGGVQQGMFIKGINIKNPVVLFLHGGPGMPTYFLERQFPSGLDNTFTVCYWEQRGAGISYSSDMKPESITVEQLISDAIEVTHYLSARFGQDKIYLMAHSWGSFVGLQAAAKAPELYHAYIGISQITNQRLSEKIAYQWMLEQYAVSDNQAKVKTLVKFPVLDNDDFIIPWFKDPSRDTCMHDLGVGTMHLMKDVYSGVFFPFLGTKDYTVAEKYNTFFRAKPFLRNETRLVGELFGTDLSKKVLKIEIPVYLFSGIYDLTVNHDLNSDYFKNLNAPLKGYYTFNASAHCPQHEEPGKFMQIMREDVLGGKNILADRA